VKQVLVRRDWSDQFDRLGLGLNYGNVRKELEEYVGEELIYPQLPTLSDFASMTSRHRHTDSTVELFQGLMGHAIHVRDLAEDTEPRQGAHYHIPDLPPAAKRQRRAVRPAGEPTILLREYLQREIIPDALGGLVGDPALQVTVRRA
jgi:hypothetical protein